MVAEIVGTRVAGRFVVTRFLGQGGMARVYVAEQPGEPREIALKIMDAALSADPRFVKRFQREAQTAALVKHANSVRIFDCGTSDGTSFIAMELLKGSDLAVVLEREGPMSQQRAAWIVAEMCDALGTAHELGIVHRDLKPENVMLIPDAKSPKGERVKVLDFGIAKLLFEEGTAEAPPDSDEAPTALTRAGTSLGTPAYMSPEQCQLLELDARSDLYTCGILLYQMMTGGVPFEGETPLHTATLHIREPLVLPSAYAPHIDSRLEAIIVKALSKARDDRHASARELGLMLRVLGPELPDAPARLGGPPASRKSKPSFRPAAGSVPSPMPLFASSKKILHVAPLDEDTDNAATIMREAPSDDDDVATKMRDAPSEQALQDHGRRGTEMLDLSAPLASPSAPLAVRAAPTLTSTAAAEPTLAPGFELAAPRVRPTGMSGTAAMLLGFVVGIALICAGLATYVFMRG